MAKKPQKAAVEELVKNLVDSEISGIQALAKDMAAHLKQLEEHSQRIKQYTDEIERLVIESSNESYDTVSLDELIKSLERTIARLRRKQAEISSDTGSVKQKISEVDIEEKLRSTSRQTGKLREKEVVASIPIEEERNLKTQFPVYTTPEGFVLRKIR